MQVDELLGVYLYGFRAVEFEYLLQCLEVDIIRGIDRLRGAEDAVRDGYPSTQHRGIFHIVDAVLSGRLSFQRVVGLDPTYSNDAVCSIPTTSVMIMRLSSGTLRKALNAAMSCFLMFLPGLSYI